MRGRPGGVEAKLVEHQGKLHIQADSYLAAR